MIRWRQCIYLCIITEVSPAKQTTVTVHHQGNTGLSAHTGPQPPAHHGPHTNASVGPQPMTRHGLHTHAQAGPQQQPQYGGNQVLSGPEPPPYRDSPAHVGPPLPQYRDSHAPIGRQYRDNPAPSAPPLPQYREYDDEEIPPPFHYIPPHQYHYWLKALWQKSKLFWHRI